MGDAESGEESASGSVPRPSDEFSLLRLKALNFATALLSSGAFARRVAVSAGNRDQRYTSKMAS